MSSKREEAKAFERLKRLLPGRDVSLEIMYKSWIRDFYYETYLAGLESEDASFGKGDTADAAVDDLIAKRKEVLDKLKAKAESESTKSAT